MMPGLWAALVGTAGLALLTPPPFALTFFLTFAAPVGIFGVFAHRSRKDPEGRTWWYPEGYLLTFLTLYPCAMFLVAFALTTGFDGGLLAACTSAMGELATQMSKGLSDDQIANVKLALEDVAHILPAMIGCSWISIMVVSAIIADVILKRRNATIRTSFSLNGLHVPVFVSALVAITGLLGFLGGGNLRFAGANMCAILCIPLFFLGLSVVHAYAATRRNGGRGMLTAFYIVLALFGFMGWPVVLVVLLGAVDQALHLRGRFGRGAQHV